MKKVLVGIFILALLVLAGCGKTDTANDKGVKPEQEELMNQYQVLINENKPVRNNSYVSNETILSRRTWIKRYSLIEVPDRLKDYEDNLFP